VLEAPSGGEVLLAYAAGPAAVESADGQVIVAGFPLETVADSREREELIAALADRLLADAGASVGACSDVGGGEDAGADAGGDVGVGLPDSGADDGADGGSVDQSPVETNDGCGCKSTNSDAPVSLALLVAMGGLLLFRRRATSPRAPSSRRGR
jgi:MYXO-CTERM domain-containing protein